MKFPEFPVPQVILRTPDRAPSTSARPRSEPVVEELNEDEVFPSDDNDADDSHHDSYDESHLHNPYYENLLNSKLDACPPQPFNETTSIVWGAVYDTVHRAHRVESMSRWEQIQRGYVRQETITSAIHHERSHDRRSRKSVDHDFHQHFNATNHGFADTVMQINDLLQMHHSLDDVVQTSRPDTVRTLAKSTGGSLEALLKQNAQSQETQPIVEAEADANEHVEGEEGLEMRNDLKWKRRKMKLHIKKKRRDGLRMKKKAMRERNQEKGT